jgi:tetratricopeptide (TPR) repeat protein
MRNKFTYMMAVAVVALALVGCESRGFKAERDMYRAHKKASPIYRNPSGTPPFQFNQAVETYRDIMKKYPDSLFAVQAKFSIGHLFVIKGDFDRARQEYKDLIVDCDKRGNLCAEAQFAIGNSYEIEKRWPEAEVVYKQILQDYPFSTKSLDLPIYVINHYRRVKDQAGMTRSVDEAVSYYLGLKGRTETDKGRYILQSLVTRAYIEAGQWADCLESLDKLARDFPENKPEEALWMKALIYHSKLKDKEKTKEELQKIVTQYPRTKFARQAELYLKKI